MIIPRLPLFLAILAAAILVKRLPTHRPFARGLAVLLAIDVLRIATAGAPWPIWCLDAVLAVGWYTCTAGIVLGALTGSWRQTADSTFAATLGIALPLCLAKVRGDLDLLPMWRAIYAGTVAAQGGAVALALVRSRRDRCPLTTTQRAALFVASSSVADIAGPWLRARPVEAWQASLSANAVLWLGLAAWQGWRWRRLRPIA